MGTVYFARWILQDNDEILENGAISVSGNTITSIGPRSKAKRAAGDRSVNLGEMLLLPGLINMHTHLEEGVVRDAKKNQEDSFSAFTAKTNARLKQFPQKTICDSIKLSVCELLTNGITTVVDSSRYGFSADVLRGELIRSWVIDEFHAEDILQEEQCFHKLQNRGPDTPMQKTGFGPHALYSVSPRMHRALMDYTYENKTIWGMHLAESAEELQAFSERKGDLYFQITHKRPWAFGETQMGSMNYALTANLIPNGGICFHCNYATGPELTLLAAKRISVALCFSYNQIADHKSFPLDVALKRNVPICLGTEGIVAPGFMDLFDELFALKRAYPHIPARDMFTWVTRNPANALRAGNMLGSLTPGKLADIIGVRFAHDPGEDLIEELVVEEPEIALVIVNGEEVIINC